jgi:hypothetical protein
MSTTSKITTIAAAAILLLVLLVVAATSTIASLFGSAQSLPSELALTDIPADYLSLYQQAATTCHGLHWVILAAIGKIETDHGRSTLPGVHSGSSSAGAQGPMQFLPTTFAAYNHPIPPGGATPPSPYHPHDAIHAAANYLCASGARDGRDIHAAIWNYNHADWYVDQVLAQADLYRDGLSGAAAMIAVEYAHAQLGQLYVWGGDGIHEGGFDCSGLTKAAYAAAGITLPRVAQDQFNAGPIVPSGQPLQRGDLVFFGTSTTTVTHVGIVVSPTQMINAPDVGQLVRVDHIGDLAGAPRPAALRSRH